MNGATTTVNSRASSLVDRLQDIPNRAREIVSHGVRQAAATALVTVRIQLGHKLHFLQPVFPEREDQADFKELVDEFDEAAGAIDNVDLDSVVNKVFCDH